MEAEPPKAVLPKRKRRWFQFRRRSLLIFTVIVAVGFAWLGSKIERKRREQAIVDAIRERGGIVELDYVNGEPAGPAWLRWLLGVNFFSDVQRVRIAHADDAMLRGFTELTQLRTLEILGDGVTDAGLVNLKGLTRLQRLYLDNTKVTDVGLVNLKALNELQRLFLISTQVTDAGLVNLKTLNELQLLRLDDTQVTDAGLVNLKGLAKLKWLSLETTRVTDAGVADLKKALPNCKISL
jgi:hypothetical protein